MPELPEVETTIKGLYIFKNKKIIKVTVNTKKLRYLIPNSLNNLLKNQSIIKIYRIAKYIVINLSNNNSLIIHLGMSGRLKILKNNYLRQKHDHFILYFDQNYYLILNDSRKFGFIDIIKTKELFSKKYIAYLGTDALSRKLNSEYFYKKVNKSDVVIKQILLNQKIISGIGNIYASEILFDAKISPLEKGCNLTIAQIDNLIKSIKKIIRKAIAFGGSSIRDYRASDGTLGNFQQKFKVYGKVGKKIYNFKIVKIIQYGRATYYCPELQKEQTSN